MNQRHVDLLRKVGDVVDPKMKTMSNGWASASFGRATMSNGWASASFGRATMSNGWASASFGRATK
jgi:hypothetical protein